MNASNCINDTSPFPTMSAHPAPPAQVAPMCVPPALDEADSSRCGRVNTVHTRITMRTASAAFLGVRLVALPDLDHAGVLGVRRRSPSRGQGRSVCSPYLVPNGTALERSLNLVCNKNPDAPIGLFDVECYVRKLQERRIG